MTDSVPSGNGTSFAAHPRTVLLLIDVQVNMLAPGTGVPNAAAVRANVAHALHCARTAHTPPRIVHVRNCGSAPGDPDVPGTPGWQLAYAAAESEPVLDKLENNAFAGTPLPALVDAQAALVVAGMQSDFCIRATCRAALARGNTVFLVEGAHATYDRPEEDSPEGHITAAPAHVVEKESESELERAGVSIIKVEDLPRLFEGLKQ
ncbi:Isochorismatase hydrolase [Phellopilus nigrolimitatus]|nr:Isochorismatase hydrolase [Phellopilus nigrolimitatus]